ncbi:MAG: hypothetical protein ACI4L9_05965 [Candidatus Coproplasma sp.]
MKFKHTFHVFVDNFSSTYKLLLYRVIVSLISFCLIAAVVTPLLHRVMDTTQFKAMSDAVTNFLSGLSALDFTAIHEAWLEIIAAFGTLGELFTTKLGEIIGGVAVIVVVYFIQRFFLGLGNYTLGAMVNDKMALHANSPFIGTLIKNLGNASLYNLIYVPLSIIFDALCVAAMWALFFLGLGFLPLLTQIFLFVTVIILLIAIKMTFTCDWLPSLIYGKKNNRQSLAYCFAYGKSGNKNFVSALSNFIVLVLCVLALNVAAILLTFGAGLLITIPSSYLILISFEFVNYCDNNEVKYFIDKNTVVKPEKEQVLTREQFFRGIDD